MFARPESKVHILRILMHLSVGHVTLLQGEFHTLPYIFPLSDLGRWADSRWVLPQISSYS